MRITEAGGLSTLNIHTLSAELDIKPASLYNHIKGIDEVKADVARYALTEMDKLTRDAAVVYAGEEALLRIAVARRDFAENRAEIYGALTLYSVLQPSEYKKMSGLHKNVVHQILDTYSLDDKVNRDFIIAFRSCLHGFVALKSIIAFGDSAGTDETFKNMMIHIIKMLEVKND